jgi:hypothetical protein
MYFAWGSGGTPSPLGPKKVLVGGQAGPPSSQGLKKKPISQYNVIFVFKGWSFFLPFGASLALNSSPAGGHSGALPLGTTVGVLQCRGAALRPEITAGDV